MLRAAFTGRGSSTIDSRMSAQNRLYNFLIGAIFALLTFGLWAYFNRPTEEPAWPQRISNGGFAFSPYRNDKSPVRNEDPTIEEIDADLALLEGKASAVRTYSAVAPFSEIPQLAAKRKLKVAVGAWLDKDIEKNEREISGLLQIAAAKHDNVVRLVVGNEVILRGDMTRDELIPYLDRVREQTDLPSTAEPWNVWVANPELAEHVDYIMVHMLPYWEGIPVENAVDHVVNRMDLLRRVFPGKSIIGKWAGFRRAHPVVPCPLNPTKRCSRASWRARNAKAICSTSWKPSINRGRAMPVSAVWAPTGACTTRIVNPSSNSSIPSCVYRNGTRSQRSR
jgi:exo-beta-1,3-glucanase (GH17 family)